MMFILNQCQYNGQKVPKSLFYSILKIDINMGLISLNEKQWSKSHLIIIYREVKEC